ncbi:MAG: hypothetical protein ACLSX0_01285 [Anaerostipes caccae]|jgi:hypothetical protein
MVRIEMPLGWRRGFRLEREAGNAVDGMVPEMNGKKMPWREKLSRRRFFMPDWTEMPSENIVFMGTHLIHFLRRLVFKNWNLFLNPFLS